MAITTLDQLTSALDSAKQSLNIYKAQVATKGAGTSFSLWTTAGSPGPGAAPSSASGAALFSGTAGAMTFTNPASGKTYLGKVAIASSNVGTLMLYDRLVHTGALSGAVATAQTVNSVALTRSTNGAGVELWCEIYTATGGTAANLTVTYTNQAGTASRVSTPIAFPTTPVAGQMFQIPLASGDTGVRSVQSAQLSASTGVAGAFGFTLLKRIAVIPITLANSGVTLDFAALGLPVIENNSCIAMALALCSTNNSGTIFGSIDLVQG